MMRGTKYNHKFYFRKTLRDNAQVPSRKPDYRAEWGRGRVTVFACCTPPLETGG
jgi:hypothetical protein